MCTPVPPACDAHPFEAELSDGLEELEFTLTPRHDGMIRLTVVRKQYWHDAQIAAHVHEACNEHLGYVIYHEWNTWAQQQALTVLYHPSALDSPPLSEPF